MENITCLKRNLTKAQALETMNYLYYNLIAETCETEEYVSWFDAEGNKIANWTNDYRNLMVDYNRTVLAKDFKKILNKALTR